MVDEQHINYELMEICKAFRAQKDTRWLSNMPPEWHSEG